MDLLHKDHITISRYATGLWEDGIFIAGAISEISIKCSVQPLSPHELLNLPEAQRTTETVKIYSQNILQTADESNLIKADRITFNGKIYEIQKVTDWSNGGISHYKSIAVKIDYNESGRTP